MLFHTWPFLIFMLVVLPGFYALRRTRFWLPWLLLASYVFYGWWDPRFCLLMAFSTLVSYTAGLGMLRHPVGSSQRKLYLVVPITLDLALLGFFKYTNFAMETVREATSLLGFPVNVPHFDIILPIGLSFYTFHTISYIVDAYRGVITPTRNVWEIST